MIQRALDGFLHARRWLVTMLAFLSFRIYASEVSWDDLWSRAFKTRRFRNLDLAFASDLDTLLSVAKDCVMEAEARRAVITDKFKLLVTLSSLLLAVISLLCPRAAVLNSVPAMVLFWVAVLLLLNVITLLLSFMAVGTDMVINVDQEMITLSPDNLRKSLINAHLLCQAESDNRTDYLVELYKVTRFFFFTAFVLVGFLGIVSQFASNSADEAERIVRQMRSDPKLIELLRGPKGTDGRPGAKGDAATVNEAEILNKVFNDPRFKQSQKTAAP